MTNSMDWTKHLLSSWYRYLICRDCGTVLIFSKPLRHIDSPVL